MSISSMLLLYAILSQSRGQKMEEEQGDVRGNIFVALARWFAREAQKLPKSEARAWVPSPLCPIGGHGIMFAFTIIPEHVGISFMSRTGDNAWEGHRR